MQRTYLVLTGRHSPDLGLCLSGACARGFIHDEPVKLTINSKQLPPETGRDPVG